MSAKSLLSKWSWQVLAVILLVLAAIAGISLRHIFNENLSDARKSDELQIQLIASILTSEMDSGRYQDIEKFFNKWAQANGLILELRLDAANGFNLASYKRPAGDLPIFEKQLPITYSYHGEAIFTARMSMEEVYRRNKELGINIAGLIAVFATLLSFLLYMAIRLQNEARRSRHLSNLYKALSEINQAIVRMEQQAELFPLVCRCAVDFGGMSMAFIALLDDKSNLFFPAVSYGNGQDYLEGIVISPLADVPEGRGPIGTAYRENRPVIVNNYSTNPLTALWKKRASANNWQSSAAFPISKEGRPFSVLSVYHSEANAFDEEAVALLDEMSRDISFALDNFDRERQRIAAVKSLQLAASVYAASSEGIMITDANNRIISVNPAFTNITGYSFEEVNERNPSILKSGRHDEAFYRAMWQSIESTGKWSGEIWDRRKTGEVYPKLLTIDTIFEVDGAVLRRVAMFTDITQNKAAEEKIQHLAFYDQLTGLPNRLLLMDRMKQALVSSERSGRNVALLFIDLDNFKNLNDTLGHDIGDKLLQQVTQRLGSCIREDDTVARLGGDEFVVMLPYLNEQLIEAAAQTEAIGEKILIALNQPYQLGSYAHRCSASIGATLFKDHQQTTEELMKQADIAMYQAKKAGRNTLRFFDQQMQESISGRVLLESELHNAIELQQFQLYYQIQVDSTNRPLGAEALIRWIHPGRGLVPPMQFIPLAEETGLILPIGQWVLETACAQIKAWEQEVLTRNLTLAVNVSAKQFRQTGFVAQVQEIIQRHAIDPKLLKLELTESLLQENIEETVAIMVLLNVIGVQFSLDDFGTGYSCLQYLKRLPLDQLKIDQSFVSDVATDNNDMTIVRTIIAMARSLDMDVLAEGVETGDQRLFLLENGCNHYQGFLFGRPVPIEQFEASLKRH